MTIASTGKGMKKLKHLYIAGENRNDADAIENIWVVLQNGKLRIWLSNFTLKCTYIPERIKTNVQANAYTQMFIVTLFTIIR